MALAVEVAHRAEDAGWPTVTLPTGINSRWVVPAGEACWRTFLERAPQLALEEALGALTSQLTPALDMPWV